MCFPCIIVLFPCIVIASDEGQSLVRGSGGILPQKIFKFWRLRNVVFSTWTMRYVSKKSTANHENGKQLQVTIIKITESKENKFIHRLGLSGSTGPWVSCRLVTPRPPPPPPASYGSAQSYSWLNKPGSRDAFLLCCLVWTPMRFFTFMNRATQ